MSKPIGISGSRAAAILGMSSYKTPLQVFLEIMESREPGYCEKNNFLYEPFEGNSQTRWGSAFESAVIELAEEKQGTEIVDRERFFATNGITKSSDLYIESHGHFLTCHIDGAYNDICGNYLVIHEGKTTSANYFYSAFGEPGTDRVPVEYQLQCQHQMICTGAEKVILSVLVFPKRVEDWEEMGWIPALWDEKRNEYFLINKELNKEIMPNKWASVLAQMGYFHQYTIHAHADLQKLMLESYAEFWNNHVLTGTPPEPKNYDDIRAICREPIGTIIATPEINNLISEYKQIGSEISSTGTLAKRREQLKTQILNFSRTAGFVEDDESRDKWVIRSQDGKKLASYGKDKNGNFIFR